MALEHRGDQTYYYRSVRRDETVHKVYVGAGELARIAHEQDTVARAGLELKERREAKELEHLEDLAGPVLEIDEAAEVLVRAALIAGGFHRHKGEWRRERRTA